MHSLLNLVDSGFGSVLPCQFNDLFRASTIYDGEHRLLLAVLEDAVQTYLTNRGRSSVNERRAYAEVRDWFFSRGIPSAGLFSFHNICDLLGIDASALLKGIQCLSAKRGSLRYPGLAMRRTKPKSIAA